MNPAGDDLTGRRLGHIRIVRLIGSGGMGTVYAGEDERLGRRVALKLIRSDGRMAPHARARLLREAKLLSQLNHPHICQIHELMETPEGDCLVLELVEGRSLRAALAHEISRTAALRIAEQLLEVLVAVHRRGIVHRDLKPENVMLTPDGGIKVLDFGIAREMEATEETHAGAPPQEPLGAADSTVSTSGSIRTVRGSRVGTLRYMSPEQARGEPATTASDVYAAGLILQEMLTGRPALDPSGGPEKLLQKAAWGDVRETPELPPALRSLLGRLLALAPSDRPSARDALERLRRILDAPRRRRRRAAAAAIFVAVSLLAAGMTLQWRRATRAAETTRRALAESRAVSDFLSGLFELSNPFSRPPKNGSREVTAEDLLQNGTGSIRSRFAGQPLTRARFMTLLGKIQRNLGQFDASSSLLEEAVAILDDHPEAEAGDRAAALRELGETRRRQGRLDEARALLERAASTLAEADPPRPLDAAATDEALALVEMDEGHPAEAAARLQEVFETRSRIQGAEHSDVALTLLRLGNTEAALSRLAEAKEHYRRALAIEQHELGPGHPGLISLYTQLGTLEESLGNPRGAERYYSRALEIADRTLDPDHPLRATLATDLANCLDNQGKYDEAERRYLEALRVTRGRLGPGHPRTGAVLLNLAMVEQHLGRRRDAEVHYRQALRIMENALGANHPNAALAMNSLGAFVQEEGRYREARRLYARAREAFATSLGPGHPYVAMTLNNLAEIDRLSGRLDQAEAGYRQALELDRTALGDHHPAIAEILRGLALTLAARGKTDEAEATFQEALGILRAADAPGDQLRADYAAFLRSRGRRAEADHLTADRPD